MSTPRIASDPTGPISRRLMESRKALLSKISDLREEIEDTKALLDILDEGWKKWDVDRLEDFGFITPAEAKLLNDYIASEVF